MLFEIYNNCTALAKIWWWRICHC